MRLAPMAFAIFGAMLGSSEAVAVTYSSSPFSKIIATARLPAHDNPQVYFSVRVGTMWSDESDLTAASDGIYYQYSGTVKIEAGGLRAILHPGDGVFLPSGTTLTLKANGAGRSPTYLQFLLSSAPELEIGYGPPGISVEVYRSPSPIPGLIRETSLLSLASVPLPPQSPYDPLHQRSGAALHYILSGVGAEFTEGRAVAKGPGSVSYEPRGLVYQWSNPGPNPLVYLVFNVNPKNLPPVVEIEDHPTDPFSIDPHITWAIYCIGLSVILMVIVCATTTRADHSPAGKRRDK
jgi:mannose-6-phosphate isomerase-like protein (cupin superfamily)